MPQFRQENANVALLYNNVGGYNVGGYNVGGYDVGGFNVGGYDIGGYDVGGCLGISIHIFLGISISFPYLCSP